MKKIGFLLWLFSAFVLSGCVVRTYQATKDRVDQDLTAGNRGYLMGRSPSSEVKERKASRTMQVIEIELHSPIKFEKIKKSKRQEPIQVATSQEITEGNRGYLSESITPEVGSSGFEKYTVQKNDTLQKISKKFFGTTKKWMKIFNANRNVLKTPNKIRPGQLINIPVFPATKESLKEPVENLK